MSEYSVYFNPPGFDDYPRTVQDTVDHVALNAHVERTDVNDIYVRGSTIPSVEDNNKIWVHVPSTGNGPAPLPPLPPLPPPTGGAITNVLFHPSVTPQTAPIGAPMFDVVNPSTGAITGTALAGSFLAVSKDGKYYSFQTDYSTGIQSIVRYNSDYSSDGTFSPIVTTGTNAAIKLKLTADNKVILYSGDAVAAPGKSLILNSVNRGLITRFNNDGSFDSTFVIGTGFTWTANPNFSGQPASIKDVSIQSNNKILIVGEFDTYKSATLSVNRIGLVRLNTNGDLDTTFTPYKSFAVPATVTLPSGIVSYLQPNLDIVFILSSENILIGERLTSVQSLLSNGDQNIFFSSVSVPTLQAPASELVQGQNNKIYHYGVYSLIRFSEETGQLDGTFTNNFTSNVIIGLSIAPNGSLFLRYRNLSSSPTTQVRLLSNGSLNNSFTPIVVPAIVGSSSSGIKSNPVVNSAPIIFLDEVLRGYLDIPFSYTVLASNSVNTFSASGLPPGLSINSSTGIISGTSTGIGVFTITVTATNAAGSSTRSSNIVVSSGIWTGNYSTPALRKTVLDVWWAFESVQRGDIIVIPEENEIVFPWGESGEIYDMSPWGEPNFAVPTLPTPPIGFKYKYYIGARISQPNLPVITL
jgi:hypothetical protein